MSQPVNLSVLQPLERFTETSQNNDQTSRCGDQNNFSQNSNSQSQTSVFGDQNNFSQNVNSQSQISGDQIISKKPYVPSFGQKFKNKSSQQGDKTTPKTTF